MRLTIAYSKIKKQNLVLINNATYQRETLLERPIRQLLSTNSTETDNIDNWEDCLFSSKPLYMLTYRKWDLLILNFELEQLDTATLEIQRLLRCFPSWIKRTKQKQIQ